MTDYVDTLLAPKDWRIILDNIDVDSPSELFLASAERRLRRDLPEDRLQSVLMAARVQLTEHAAELVKRGIHQRDADNKAVSAFGGYEEWTQGIIQAFYADPITSKASLFAFVCAGIILFTSVVESAFNNFTYDALINPMLVVLLVGVFAGSYRSRQSRAPGFDRLLPVASVLMFFIGGTQWVPLHGIALPRSVVQSELYDAQEPGEVVADDPARAWTKEAPLWLTFWNGPDIARQQSIMQLEQVANIEPGLNVSAGFFVARTSIMLAVLISLVDWMGMYLGRLVFRRLQRGRPLTDFNTK